MPPRRIVIGQKVDPEKAQFAEYLRKNMTLEEKTLWQNLRANRLSRFHFRRQQVLCGYIVDFYCHACALVVEVDGESHCYKPKEDARREAVLRSQGFKILRFTTEQIREEIGPVLEEIERHLTPQPPSLKGKG